MSFDLNLNDASFRPSIEIPYLNTAPLNTAADIPASVSPIANSNQSGGFDISAVTNTLVNLLDNGAQVYNSLAKTLGTPQLGQQPAPVAPVAAPVFAGLNNTQLIWMGVAGGLVVLLLIIKRR